MDVAFRKRMRRRLYYGDMANLNTPSLPMTEVSVAYFKGTVSQKLGHVDIETASDLMKRNHVSPCSVVLSMLYAKRLKERNKDYLSTMSSSDVFFISMMVASKYLYDEGVSEEVFNDEWADNTDQDVDDVNDMEMDFLQAMDWKLFVRPEEFEDALAAIEKRLALQEGLNRGWFTYSELATLADINLLSKVLTHVGMECSKLMTMLSAAYVTSLLSLLGSTALAFQLAGPLSTVTVALLTLNLCPALVPNPSGIQQYNSLPASQPLNGFPVVASRRPVENQTKAILKCNRVWVGQIASQNLHHWSGGSEGETFEIHNDCTLSDVEQSGMTEDSWLEEKESVPLSVRANDEVVVSCHPSSSVPPSVRANDEVVVSCHPSSSVPPSVRANDEVVVSCHPPSSVRANDEAVVSCHPSSGSSSLWSLLLLDSLLTQLWSVASGKRKASTANHSDCDAPHTRPIHCHRWSSSRRRQKMMASHFDRALHQKAAIEQLNYFAQTSPVTHGDTLDCNKNERSHPCTLKGTSDDSLPSPHFSDHTQTKSINIDDRHPSASSPWCFKEQRNYPRNSFLNYPCPGHHGSRPPFITYVDMTVGPDHSQDICQQSHIPPSVLMDTDRWQNLTMLPVEPPLMLARATAGFHTSISLAIRDT